MAGKPQKPPHKLVDDRPSRRRDVLAIEVAESDGEASVIGADGKAQPMAVPDPPAEVSAGAKERWRKFFMSPVAVLVDMRAHGEALTHWCRLISEREELWQEWLGEPTVLGSKAQRMTNPLWLTVRDLDREIARYEDQFGMTPLAQMRLGVEFLRGRNMESGLKGPLSGLPRGPVPMPRRPPQPNVPLSP